MTEPIRPPFIDEETWSGSTAAWRLEQFLYAKNLMELAEDPRFRSVVARWVDEIAGVSAGTLDPSECGLVGHQTLMAVREGRRHVGIQIMQHLQAVAPRMWMRALQEMKNARTRADLED